MVTYFLLYDTFLVYHVLTGKQFLFKNSFWKQILLNPHKNLDYTFFAKNGKPYIMAEIGNTKMWRDNSFEYCEEFEFTSEGLIFKNR